MTTPARLEPDTRSANAEMWRSRVLDHLDLHAADVVQLLAELVRIPSVSGSDAENDIQAHLAGHLERAALEVDHWSVPLPETLAAPSFPGVETVRSEAWGLVGRLPGRRPGAAPSLMLNAHVDVVPAGHPSTWAGHDPFGGHVDARHVWGRGACDMKGGLVAALWAARALAELRVPLQGDLLVACVQGEEDGGLGTFATLRRGWTADACVIPEPTSLDLVTANAGSLTFRLTITGLASHASRRTSGVSAVEKFQLVLPALRTLERRRNADVDPRLQRWDIAYPLEVGRVRAGNWSSSVPDVLVAEGRYGVALGEEMDEARAAFLATVAEVNAADPWLREHPVEVEWWGGQFAPGETQVDATIAGAVRRAHRSVSARPQEEWGAPYGSDLRLMSGLGGVPTVHYGPGDAGLAHGPRERVPIDDVLTTARALAVLALEHCLL
ncbi:ArgE/DapE family deacylase [uncultured Friedmanniella sp.]|uniref:ArgE/DapE family deacylase n=1 Tax=uncultured Friedmanniella sp. TaxID=335381 RepID=UPI0035CAA710